MESKGGSLRVFLGKESALLRNALEVFFKWAAEFSSGFTYYKSVQVT